MTSKIDLSTGRLSHFREPRDPVYFEVVEYLKVYEMKHVLSLFRVVSFEQ